LLDKLFDNGLSNDRWKLELANSDVFLERMVIWVRNIGNCCKN